MLFIRVLIVVMLLAFGLAVASSFAKIPLLDFGPMSALKTGTTTGDVRFGGDTVTFGGDTVIW
jgi:hypothetical protein